MELPPDLDPALRVAVVVLEPAQLRGSDDVVVGPLDRRVHGGEETLEQLRFGGAGGALLQLDLAALQCERAVGMLLSHRVFPGVPGGRFRAREHAGGVRLGFPFEPVTGVGDPEPGAVVGARDRPSALLDHMGQLVGQSVPVATTVTEHDVAARGVRAGAHLRGGLAGGAEPVLHLLPRRPVQRAAGPAQNIVDRGAPDGCPALLLVLLHGAPRTPRTPGSPEHPRGDRVADGALQGCEGGGLRAAGAGRRRRRHACPSGQFGLPAPGVRGRGTGSHDHSFRRSPQCSHCAGMGAGPCTGEATGHHRSPSVPPRRARQKGRRGRPEGTPRALAVLNGAWWATAAGPPVARPAPQASIASASHGPNSLSRTSRPSLRYSWATAVTTCRRVSGSPDSAAR